MDLRSVTLYKARFLSVGSSISNHSLGLVAHACKEDLLFKVFLNYNAASRTA